MPVEQSAKTILRLSAGLAIACSLAMPGAATAAWGRWDIDAGMEYLTANLNARAHDNRYFQTIIQSTLATVAIGWELGPVAVRARSGWTDWLVSGEWQASGQLSISSDYLYSSTQQQWEGTLAVRLVEGVEAGVSISDHRLKHYYGPETLLQFRQHWIDFFAGYAIDVAPDVTLRVALAYAPQARLEISQDPQRVYSESFSAYTAAANGSGWEGRFEAHYCDSAGWGIRFDYRLSRAAYSHPGDLAEITLFTGQLMGQLEIYF